MIVNKIHRRTETGWILYLRNGQHYLAPGLATDKVNCYLLRGKQEKSANSLGRAFPTLAY